MYFNSAYLIRCIVIRHGEPQGKHTFVFVRTITWNECSSHTPLVIDLLLVTYLWQDAVSDVPLVFLLCMFGVTTALFHSATINNRFHFMQCSEPCSWPLFSDLPRHSINSTLSCRVWSRNVYFSLAITIRLPRKLSPTLCRCASDCYRHFYARSLRLRHWRSTLIGRVSIRGGQWVPAVLI